MSSDVFWKESLGLYESPTSLFLDSNVVNTDCTYDSCELELDDKIVQASLLAVSTKKLNIDHEVQVALRESMAWWAGYRRAEGHDDSEIFKLFYITFEVDWLTAHTLSAIDAEKLKQRIEEL